MDCVKNYRAYSAAAIERNDEAGVRSDDESSSSEAEPRLFAEHTDSEHSSAEREDDSEDDEEDDDPPPTLGRIIATGTESDEVCDNMHIVTGHSVMVEAVVIIIVNASGEHEDCGTF